jgi:hypothetical protein
VTRQNRLADTMTSEWRPWIVDGRACSVIACGNKMCNAGWPKFVARGDGLLLSKSSVVQHPPSRLFWG